jgi:hypothetical protein
MAQLFKLISFPTFLNFLPDNTLLQESFTCIDKLKKLQLNPVLGSNSTRKEVAYYFLYQKIDSKSSKSSTITRSTFVLL